jgi:hypothetical protein
MARKVAVPVPPAPDLRIALGQSGLSGLKRDVDPHLSVSDQVHAVLRRAHAPIQLAPNARISEHAVCKQFSVSPTPERAAIKPPNDL